MRSGVVLFSKFLAENSVEVLVPMRTSGLMNRWWISSESGFFLGVVSICLPFGTGGFRPCQAWKLVVKRTTGRESRFFVIWNGDDPHVVMQIGMICSLKFLVSQWCIWCRISMTLFIVVVKCFLILSLWSSINVYRDSTEVRWSSINGTMIEYQRSVEGTEH